MGKENNCTEVIGCNQPKDGKCYLISLLNNQKQNVERSRSGKSLSPFVWTRADWDSFEKRIRSYRGICIRYNEEVEGWLQVNNPFPDVSED